MFKQFQDPVKGNMFRGFPNLNFQVNKEAYGITSVSSWFDASYGLSVMENLSAINQWNDKVSENFGYQNTAGLQPRLIKNDLYFNGYPSVDFYELTRGFYLSNSIRLSNQKTIALVGSNTDTCTGSSYRNTVLSSSTSTGVGQVNVVMHGDTGGSQTCGWGIASGYTAAIDSGVVNSSPHIMVVAGNFLIFDGVIVSETVWSGVMDAIYLGGDSNSACLYGKIAELIIYDQPIRSYDALRLCDNLNNKYDIY